MSIYEETAERMGATLAPYTDGYLRLYNNGVKLLERYIKHKKVEGEELYITTEDIEKYVNELLEKILMD